MGLPTQGLQSPDGRKVAWYTPTNLPTLPAVHFPTIGKAGTVRMRYPLPLMHVRHDIMFLKNFLQSFCPAAHPYSAYYSGVFLKPPCQKLARFSLTISMIFRFLCSAILLPCGFTSKYAPYQTEFEQDLAFTDHATSWRALGNTFLGSSTRMSRRYTKPFSGISANSPSSEASIGYQTKPPFVSVVNPTLSPLMWRIPHIFLHCILAFS